MKMKFMVLLALLLLSSGAFAACNPFINSFDVKNDGEGWVRLTEDKGYLINAQGLEGIRIYYLTRGLCQHTENPKFALVKIGSVTENIAITKENPSELIILPDKIAALGSIVRNLKPGKSTTLGFQFMLTYADGVSNRTGFSDAVDLKFSKPECKTSIISPAQGEKIRLGPKRTTFELESNCEIQSASLSYSVDNSAKLVSMDSLAKKSETKDGKKYLAGISAQGLAKYAGKTLEDVAVQVQYRGEQSTSKADGEFSIEVVDCGPKIDAFLVNGREVKEGGDDYIKFSELQSPDFENVTIQTSLDRVCDSPQSYTVSVRAQAMKANEAWVAKNLKGPNIVLASDKIFKKDSKSRSVDELLKQVMGNTNFTVSASYPEISSWEGYGATVYNVMVNPPEQCTAAVKWPSQTVIGSEGLKGIVVTPSEGCEIAKVNAKAVRLSGGFLGFGATKTELGDIGIECDKTWNCTAKAHGFAKDGIRGEGISLELHITFKESVKKEVAPLSPLLAVIDCTPRITDITAGGKVAREYISMETLQTFEYLRIGYSIDSACKADNSAAPKIFIEGEGGKWELACGRTQSNYCTRTCKSGECVIEIKKDAEFSEAGGTRKPALSGLLSGEAFFLNKQASFSVMENFEGLGLSYGKSEGKTLLMGRPPQCSASLVPPTNKLIGSDGLKFGIRTNCQIAQVTGIANKSILKANCEEFTSESKAVSCTIPYSTLKEFAGGKVELEILVNPESEKTFLKLKDKIRRIEVIDCSPVITKIVADNIDMSIGRNITPLQVDKLQTLEVHYTVPEGCELSNVTQPTVTFGSVGEKAVYARCQDQDYGCSRKNEDGGYSIEVTKGKKGNLPISVVRNISQALKQLYPATAEGKIKLLEESSTAGLTYSAEIPVQFVSVVPTCTIKSAKIGEVTLSDSSVSTITLGPDKKELVLEVEGEGCGEINLVRWSVSAANLSNEVKNVNLVNGKLTIPLSTMVKHNIGDGTTGTFEAFITGQDNGSLGRAGYGLAFKHPAICEIKIKKVEVEYVVNKGQDSEKKHIVTLEKGDKPPVFIPDMGNISKIAVYYSVPEAENCGDIKSYGLQIGEKYTSCKELGDSPFYSVSSFGFAPNEFSPSQAVLGDFFDLTLLAYFDTACAVANNVAKGTFQVKNGSSAGLAALLKAAEPPEPAVAELILEGAELILRPKDGKIQVSSEQVSSEKRIGIAIDGIDNKGKLLNIQIKDSTDDYVSLDNEVDRKDYLGKDWDRRHYVIDASLANYSLTPTYTRTFTNRVEPITSIILWVNRDNFTSILQGNMLKLTVWQEESKKKSVTVSVFEPEEFKRVACQIEDFVIKVNYDNDNEIGVSKGMIFTEATLKRDPSNSVKKLKFLDSTDKVLFELDYGSAKPFANQLAKNKDKLAAVRFEIYPKDNLSELLCSETWTPEISDQVAAGKPAYTFASGTGGARLDFFVTEVLDVVVKGSNGPKSKKLVEILWRGTATAKIYQVLGSKDVLLDTKAPIVDCGNGDCTLTFNEFLATFGDYKVEMDLTGDEENTRIPISFELKIRQK